MNVTSLILDEMRPAAAYEAGYLDGLREIEERAANQDALAASQCGRSLAVILDRIDGIEPSPHLPQESRPFDQSPSTAT